MTVLSWFLLVVAAIAIAILFAQSRRKSDLENMLGFMWRHLPDDTLKEMVYEALVWKAGLVAAHHEEMKRISAGAGGDFPVLEIRRVEAAIKGTEEDFYLAYDNVREILNTLGRGKKLLRERDWREYAHLVSGHAAKNTDNQQ